MIKISTMSDYLDAMRNETIALTEASVNTMFEQQDAFDTILDEIRESRKIKNPQTGSPDPVVVNNPSREEVESYMGDEDPLAQAAAQKLASEYFNPVGQQTINGGIRYYEAKTDVSPSQIRYVDVNQAGMSSPSNWTEVDRDDDDMFYIDEQGKRVNIGDLDYDDSIGKFLLPKAGKKPTGTVIHDEAKPDEQPDVEENVPASVKRKAPSASPPENSVAVWEPVFSMNVVDESGKSEFKSIKLPTIVTDKKFPTRKLVDAIRTLLDARVNVGMRDGRFTIIAKSKKSGDDYKSLSIIYRNVVEKSELGDYLHEHNITPATPEQFIQELRKVL